MLANKLGDCFVIDRLVFLILLSSKTKHFLNIGTKILHKQLNKFPIDNFGPKFKLKDFDQYFNILELLSKEIDDNWL